MRPSAYQSLYLHTHKTLHLPSIPTEPNMPPNADLSIPKTTQRKTKRRTKKYRAIVRPDGIIVESPRYRPAGTSHKTTKRLEENVAPPNHIDTQPELVQGGSSSNMRHDLMGMDMSVCLVSVDAKGSDGHIGLSERGGGGYNEATARDHTPNHAVANGCEQQSCRCTTPMARFLCEWGPWSSFCLHAGSEERRGSDTASASSVSKGKAAASDSAMK